MELSWRNFRLAHFILLGALLYPILIPVTILVFIFCKLSAFCVKKFHKDGELIEDLMEPFSQITANDFFKPSPRFNIVVVGTIEGYLSISNFRQIISTCLTESKTSKSQLEFPELTSQIVGIGGYYYWKRIQNFNIKDYVNLYHVQEPTFINRITTETDLKGIFAALSSKPWEGDKSPWECLLINNYVEDSNSNNANSNNPENNIQNEARKSLIIFRVHHCMADGYSIVNLLTRCGTGAFKVAAEAKSNLKRQLTESKGQKGGGGGQWKQVLAKALRTLIMPLWLLYPFAVTLELVSQSKFDTWRLSPRAQKTNQNRQINYQEWSAKISVATIKTIKDKFDVSFQAVLNTVFAGAIQNLMKISKQEVPDEISVFLPIPLPAHPGGLTNYVGYLVVRLPVGESDSIKRMEMASKELQNLSKTPLPLLLYIMQNILGNYPYVLTRHLISLDIGYTAVFSPFPFLDGVYSFGDSKMTDLMFNVGPGSETAGATLTTLSSFGKIRFGISVDQRVCPSEENLCRFNEFIQTEIKNLLNEKSIIYKNDRIN